MAIDVEKQHASSVIPEVGKPSRLKLFLIALLFNVALYELPYALTLNRTGWTQLPPTMAVDQMLYLNVSAVSPSSSGGIVNPWYGDQVQSLDVPHLRFAVAFQAFRLVHAALHSFTLAMLFWAAAWAVLTFFAAFFCIDSLFTDYTLQVKLGCATALLVLQSPLLYIAELRHLPSLAGTMQWHLPYLRFAIPQVVVPFVLAYVGMLVRVLVKPTWLRLFWAAVLQFCVLCIFPYFLPVLALGTGFALLFAKLSNAPISWMSITLFGAVCGFLDIGYASFAGLGRSHGNVQFALQFRPDLILPSVRPYMLLLVGAAIAALILSQASIAAKAVSAGIAFSNAFAGFSDVFLTSKAQVLDHPFYIIGLTTWLPLLCVVYAALQSSGATVRRAVLTVLLMTGLWESLASYKSSEAINLSQSAAIASVNALSLGSDDLVIAPSEFADDISSWVPLVSKARVLYTPDGENMLSAAATASEQTLRQAAYLAAQGLTVTSLELETADDDSSHLNSLLQQGERAYARSPLQSDRLRARTSIRTRLEPYLQQLETDSTLGKKLVHGYSRIIVMDNVAAPVFSTAAFTRWLNIQSTDSKNGFRIWICKPKE